MVSYFTNNFYGNNQIMQKTNIFFGLIFLFAFPLFSYAQSESMALMPIRVNVNQLEQTVFTITVPTSFLILNPRLDPNSIKMYEERYEPLFSQHLKDALKWEDLEVAVYDADSKEEREQEESLYNAMTNEHAMYRMENSKALFKSEAIKKMKQTGNSKELTSRIGKELGQNYLVYYSFSGYHMLKKKEKKGGVLPPYARGNMWVFAWFIDAQTGLIVDDFSIEMFKGLPGNENLVTKEISEKDVISFVKKVAKKTKRKLGKFD
jgi:hypothetical protein